MATMMTEIDSLKESISTNPAPARTSGSKRLNADSAFSQGASPIAEKTTDKKSAVSYAPGWEPAVLTDSGSAMCRLIDFETAFAALGVEDRAYFAYRVSELLVEACDAETARRR